MELHKNELIEAGLQIVSVGIGEPKHAARYCPKLAPSLICLVPEAGGDSAHRTYGLKNATAKEVATQETGKIALKNVLKGNFGGIPTGNTQMMPGTFIVNPQGKIIFAYYSDHIADHPQIEELVAIVNKD
ncbi:MAG: AhpC/TSA family protein [bacterium]|nr:AhpC/TSA family protein [bacterium]